MLGEPWGRVTLFDLAVGLIAEGIWIRFREGSLGQPAAGAALAAFDVAGYAGPVSSYSPWRKRLDSGRT